MPNWCYTRYEATGKDAKRLYNLFEYASENATLKTDFGPNWLGHLLLTVGVDEETVRTSRDRSIYCRGSITDKSWDEKNGVFTFGVETAWEPMNGCIQTVIDRGNFDVEIEYFAVEDGNGVYEASSINMTEGMPYLVDADISESQLEDYPALAPVSQYGFTDEKTIRKVCVEMGCVSVITLDEMLEDLTDFCPDEDIICSIHKISFASPIRRSEVAA